MDPIEFGKDRLREEHVIVDEDTDLLWGLLLLQSSLECDGKQEGAALVRRASERLFG